MRNGAMKDDMETKDRFNGRTERDQTYRSFGDGKVKIVRYVGSCEVCATRAYDNGDGNDPRGFCGLQTDATLDAKEHNLLRDVRICYGCAQEAERYKRACEIGRKP